MEIGTKIYEDLRDTEPEEFNAQQLEMVLTCDANGWCMEDGYDEDGRRYLIINPPYEASEEEILAEAKAVKLQEIDSWTKAAIVGGFTSSAGGENALFDSDENDQQNLQIMLNASKSPDFETSEYQGIIPIRGIPNGEVAKKIYYLNAAAMQQLSDDLARHIGSCKLRGWALQEATAVAQSKEELDAIVWENS